MEDSLVKREWAQCSYMESAMQHIQARKLAEKSPVPGYTLCQLLELKYQFINWRISQSRFLLEFHTILHLEFLAYQGAFAKG